MTTSSLSRVAGHLSPLCAFGLGLVPFLATTAGAEPAPTPLPAVLPPVVVTATRLPTVAEQTAAAVTVITRAELEQAQIGDALSALKTVPGLNIADNGMPGQTAGVFMRGTESRHTVILLDGHRLPTGLQRYFDLGFFPLANIDRIEVVRGPLGSTQGGGALGGAINFITRRDVPDGPAGEITGEYGSYATGNAGLGVTAESNGVSANVERIEVVRGPLGSTQGGGALGGAINFITRHGATDRLTGQVDGEFGSFNTGRAELAVSTEKNGVHANLSGASFTTDNRRPNSEFTAASTLNTMGWDISPTTKLELLAGYLHRDGGNPGAGTQTTASDPDESLEQNLGLLSPSLSFSPSAAWTHTLNFSYARQQSFARQTAFVSDNVTTVRTQ